jgi:hypothetical protein
MLRTQMQNSTKLLQSILACYLIFFQLCQLVKRFTLYRINLL